MQDIPTAVMEYVLQVCNELIGTLKIFVLTVSSSPPTFVIVMETSFPFKPRFSAVSSRIRLICAPLSKRTFPRLNNLSEPQMLTDIIGSNAALFSFVNATPTFTFVLLSSGSFKATKTSVVFSYEFQAIFMVKRGNFFALIGKVRGIFTKPTLMST